MNSVVPKTNYAPNHTFALTPEKPRLIIISDASERTTRLHAALSKEDTTIKLVNVLAPKPEVCWCEHDLALVDVAPERLLEVLSQLRASRGCEAISILVDVTRLTAQPSLAGVLSAYRAMPCGGYELLRLARRRLAALANPAFQLSTQSFTISTL
jgi:pyrroline-5-carboxylate reductase